MDKLIDGFIIEDTFYMLQLMDKKVFGVYELPMLKRMARLSDKDIPISFIDKNKNEVHIPVELNKELSQELLEIANKIDNQ